MPETQVNKLDSEMAKRIQALPDPDLTDADNPEWTDDDFARGRRLRRAKDGPDAPPDGTLGT